ncbi:efflux RND transporter permease subunit [Polymorphum gilvum]|uniref:RND transporter, HAE1/HME family, permease protein n=1 Tax=Polymorphum gilvum (strain LMG 25793 / CGMCC 1.9160 / SL003B-26A1) TaxID=991905 RepID=F2J0I0_POLGS|nr:efflux RND transporter permease subunit [Polymorphum gilvum]ADZ69648.1 RND transporter, HAE1/HME family, permease protein [Polymorphum gilvum SL003B-26A1]
MRSPGGARFGSLLDYMVRHGTAANLLLVLMLIGGIAAGLKIRTQYFPDVVNETVTVSVKWSGAGPDDMDRAVVEVLAPGLLAIDGVEEASSVAREGSARLILEFEAGWDMAAAAEDVKTVVDQNRSNLPEGADLPVVTRGAFRDRVTNVVLYGPVDIDQLVRLADDLQTRLFRAGVTNTTLRGVADPIIRVTAREATLIRHDLTLRDIADAIRTEIEASPAGDIASGAARLRAGQNRRSEQDLGDIALRSQAGGEKLVLRAVTDIVTEGVESGLAFSHKGMPAVVLRVDRSAEGDTIKIQRTVEQVVGELQPSLPSGVVVTLTETRSQAIIDRLNILVENGLFGLALVLGFLFLFLSARTAFWVAAGIPVAMAATIGIMYASGLTLNMMSLFALIICLGIVVDDAIVVGEHADFLARKGHSPTEAASLAARRMTAPVISASITTIIAFSALAAIDGRFGSLIQDIPFTVGVVLVASLIESFLILPAHMRHALAAGAKKATWYDAPNRVFNRGFRWFTERVVRRSMRVVVFLRYPVIGLCVMLLLVSASLHAGGTVPWRFFNSPERNVVSANIAMMPGATRDDTRAMIAEMERALDVVNARYAAEYGREPVLFSLAQVGGSAGWGFRAGETKDPDQLGGLDIELIDPDLRPYSAFKFLGDWQREVTTGPLLETLSLRGMHSGPGGDAIDVRLYGATTEILKAAAESLKQSLSALPGVGGLEDTMAFDKAEITVTLTPKGEALGFRSDLVARELRDRLEGVEVAEFPLDRRTAKVKVNLPDEETGASFLYETRLRSPGGAYVALGEIVRIESASGFASVRRENGLRTIRVTGDVSGDDPDAAQAVSRALRQDLLPGLAETYGVDSELGGLAKQERDFLNDALIGLGLCLAGIYLTLAWIFESWTRPIVIMLVIPFGAIGMVWGHHWHGLPLSMFSIIGFIGMAGIIINDSIVLVTTIDEKRSTAPFQTALIDGVCDRLRAVILTSATTVFGLAPLLFETSRAAQFLLPTVITLAYGLGFGLVLVLILTPALLAVQHDIGRALRSGRRLAALAGRRRKPLGVR